MLTSAAAILQRFVRPGHLTAATSRQCLEHLARAFTSMPEKAGGDKEGPVVHEGKAKIHNTGNDVFYNEAQVTNRDLSIAVLRSFLPIMAKEVADGSLKKQRFKQKHAEAAAAAAAASSSGKQQTIKGARVLEGLAATGLRSIRYALEVPGVGQVDANDLDPAVVESMRANIALNGAEVEAKVVPHCSDARLLMLQNPAEYDAVDLDPYGTPAHLLDTAVQAVADGGLLMVTATDMAVLCGNSGEVCWTKYGGYPIHRSYCHEGALRILLACIESHANRYKRHIVPLLSLSVDFYVRVFVRVYTSAAVVKQSACKLAYLWQSQGCDSFYFQRVGQEVSKNGNPKFMPGHGPSVGERCPETGARFLMGGPLWAEPLFDPAFVGQLLAALDHDKERYAAYARIRGLLTSVTEELPDVPLYYNLHDICKTVHCTPPKAATFRSALINAGYRVSGSHANPLAVKTDAPPSVIWDILRCWIKDHPIKPVDPNSYAGKLLAKEPQLQANFAKAKGSVSAAQQQGVTRFAQNPAFWGPKARHGKLDKAEMLQHAAAQQGARQQRKRGKQQQQQQQQEGEEEAGPSTSGQAPAAAAAAAAAAAGGDGTAGNTAAAAAAAPTGAAAGDANGTHEGPPAGAKQAGSEAAGSPAAKKQKVGAAATT